MNMVIRRGIQTMPFIIFGNFNLMHMSIIFLLRGTICLLTGSQI